MIRGYPGDPGTAQEERRHSVRISLPDPINIFHISFSLYGKMAIVAGCADSHDVKKQGKFPKERKTMIL